MLNPKDGRIRLTSFASINASSYKALGYVHELQAKGIDDPIAFYKEEVMIHYNTMALYNQWIKRNIVKFIEITKKPANTDFCLSASVVSNAKFNNVSNF